MITLATLKDATAQQVFDQVAAHLLKQNEQSRNEDDSKCMYRGVGGLICAAGCLISDEEYSPDMDVGSSVGGGSWGSMVAAGTVPEHHSYLITQLQRIHDSSYPHLFKQRLINLAASEGLVFNELSHEG